MRRGTEENRMCAAVRENARSQAHRNEEDQERGKIARLALPLTLGLVALACFGQSVVKLFWYDELITLRIASFPTLGEIYRFYQSGKDTTSFLPAMLVHLSQHLAGRSELTARLPFTIAYLIACFCIWIFIRRRYAIGYAISGVLLFAQGSSFYFASEARAYAFVLMGTAIAVVCWQSADRGDRFVGLATLGVFLGLATAILFHFFAIFLFVPFVIAELFYGRTTQRRRWSMWLSIALFPCVISIMLPNLLAAKHIYGESFWSKPTVSLLIECYTLFMEPVSKGLAEIMLLMVASFLIGDRTHRISAEKSPAGASGFTRPEWVLLVAIGVVPCFVFAGAHFLGAFRTQYVLYFQIGMLLLVIGGLAEVLQRRKETGWVLALIMLLLFSWRSKDYMRQGLHHIAGRSSVMPATEYRPDWLEFVLHNPLPVVAEGPDTLLVVEQYGPLKLRQRLSLLTSHQHALLYPEAMTNELNMEVFGKTLGLPIQDYDQFVRAHRDFLLLVSPQQTEYTWLLRSLMKESETDHDVHLEIVWANAPWGGADQVYLVHFGT
jgi:hypothetical protein